MTSRPTKGAAVNAAYGGAHSDEIHLRGGSTGHTRAIILGDARANAPDDTRGGAPPVTPPRAGALATLK